MKYQASFISSQEMEILSDEPSEYFKLYAYIRSKMNIDTKISGLDSRFSTQAFRELLAVSDKRGRHKKNVKESESYNSGMIQKRLSYLEKIGLIKRRNDLGCFVFEHVCPLLPKSVQNDEGQTMVPMRDIMKDKKTDVKVLKLKENTNNEGQHEGMYEGQMRVTPHRYIDNIDINNIYTSPAVTDRGFPRDKFNEFWKLYPRKVGKKACEKKFISTVKKDPSLTGVILSALKKQLPVLLEKEPKYVPNPLTWLNQGRWDDEAEATKPDWMF